MSDYLYSLISDPSLWDALGAFKDVVERIRTGWIAPAFLLIVAGVALMMAIKREVRGLIMAIIVFIVAGVLVYAPTVIEATATQVAGNTHELSF